MINNFVLEKFSTAYSNLDFLDYKMFAQTSKQLNAMHMVALATKRLCAGYWVGFTPSNEQDPIKMASFYKESGHK